MSPESDRETRGICVNMEAFQNQAMSDDGYSLIIVSVVSGIPENRPKSESIDRRTT